MALLDVVAFSKKSFTAGIEIDSNSGTPTIDTTNFYSSGAPTGMRINGAASNQFITRQFINNSSTRFWQFRMRIHDASGAPASGTGSAMALFRDAVNGNGPSIRLLNTRVLQLWDEQNTLQKGSNSSALSVDTWYLIGISYNKSTGAIALYINDMTTPVASGSTTASMTMDTLRLGSIDAFTCDITFCDLIVTDSSGASMTTFAGDVKIHYTAPTGAGEVNTFATQTGGTAGSANNFGRVNEDTPDDATTFNGSSTLNQEDLFDVTDSPSDVGTVLAYVVGGRFRNSTADTAAALKFEIEKANGGTKTQSASIIPNSTTFRTNVISTTLPKTYPIITYTDPDGTAWTKTTVDSSRIGYKLTTAPGTSGRRIDVTNVWGYVIYQPVTNVTTTQTITGTSRITASTNQTITGKSRIQEITTQTITGKSRIRETVNQTITGVSRIRETVNKTITGLSRITATTLQAITGKSRIQETTAQTITGKSRIQETVNKTIAGLSRITATTVQTITGKSRIQETTSQTIAGKSRIQETTSQTITGKALIEKQSTQTITGQSRIRATTNQIITGVARIQKIVSQTISGVSRIQKTVSQTITGKSRIQESVNKTITGQSRIQQTTAQTIPGKARVQIVNNQTINGKSRVQETTTQTINGKSRVQLTTTQTITGRAFIIAAPISGLGSTNTVLKKQRDDVLLALIRYQTPMKERDFTTTLQPHENRTVLQMRSDKL